LVQALCRRSCTHPTMLARWRASRKNSAEGDASHQQLQPIPQVAVWGITVLTPICVAFVNYFMVVADTKLLDMKFQSVERLMLENNLIAGTLTLGAFCGGFALLAIGLVILLSPSCAGSGIPEVLSFLNGNHLPGLFTLPSLVVRVSSMVLVQAAGFPVGREGPMIGIGGCVGYGVACMALRVMSRRHEQPAPVSVRSTGEIDFFSSDKVIDEERVGHIRRIGCALGGAAGIATAFNAPIGGIIYMFEEMAVSSLPPDFAKFMCTVTSAFVARGLLELTHMDIHRLVIYEQKSMNSSGNWKWADLPWFIISAGIFGACGAVFSSCFLRTWSLRQKMARKLQKYQPFAKVVECLLFCILCSIVWSVVPLLVKCEDNRASSDDTRRLGGSSLKYVQYTCPDGQHNPIANLLLSGAEGAVKHLYSRTPSKQPVGALIISLCTYGLLAMGMPGLPIPMGSFIPTLLVGALGGRLFGNFVSHTNDLLGAGSAPAGVYAVLGSAAMLSGFTHMTIGIVALLTEAINDLGLIAPLMLTVYVAQLTSKYITHFGYDEQLIIRKGVPFLDSELPHEFENFDLRAIDLCDALPQEAILPQLASLASVKRALRSTGVHYFPVLAPSGICVGITTRNRLKAVVSGVVEDLRQKARMKSVQAQGRRPSNASNSTVASEGSDATSHSVLSSVSSPSKQSLGSGSSRPSQANLADVQTERKLASLIRTAFAQQKKADDDMDGDDSHRLLPLERVIDPAPYMLLESMPVQRFYVLFLKAAANVACVVSSQGEFCGLITRSGLCRKASELQQNGPRKPEPKTSPQKWLVGKEPAANQASEDRSLSGGDIESNCLSIMPFEHASRVCETSSREATASNSTAVDFAENLSPEQLRAQLTSAWAQLAACENKRETLQQQLNAEKVWRESLQTTVETNNTRQENSERQHTLTPCSDVEGTTVTSI